MKLYDLLFESKDKPETLETFADTREKVLRRLLTLHTLKVA